MRGVLCQRYVHIEATNTKCIDRSGTRASGRRWPCHRRSRHEEWAVLPVKIWVQLIADRSGRDEAVLHGQHHFDETGHTRSFERVADVGFDAANRDLLSWGQVLAYER